MASRLFALDGVQVAEVDAEAGGGRTVWVVTADRQAAACPGCGTVSARVKGYVTTRPADLRHGQDKIAVVWVKRRLECREPSCPRKTFTESLAQVPPRCRVTTRLRGHAAGLVADGGRTVAQAARECGLSWPVVHEAFADRADPVLGQPPALAAHLGIDEHRRGRPRWRIDADTGEYVLLADRWHTCFFDLSGDQGLLGQVEGRTADDAAYWLAQAAPAWRDHVQVVAMDMCSIYKSAVRRMLPSAQIVADLFHVVQLAVKMTGDVRRRVVREKYGRRGRSGDPEYGVKGLLVRNLEHLSAAQFAKIIDTLDRDRYGQEIAAAWISKEKLRDALNLRARVTGSVPCERQVRDRLFAFYDWCARHDDIPELITLARTISRWEEEITAAVITGITNATSESLNRLAKLEARLAYGFRNPLNQRRRVRIACTRGYRRRSRPATPRRTHTVTGRQPDPANVEDPHFVSPH
jgi:transposase